MQGYYRGARAALKLGSYEEALELCKRGMAVDGEASELQQLKLEAEKKAKVCRQLMSCCQQSCERCQQSSSICM